MAEVKVTFLMEGDDPGDPTGVSEDQFENLMQTLMELGGHDIKIEQA